MDKIETAEYVKCRKDPVYFIKKYSYIRHPTKGLIKFDLWDFQEEVLNDFITHSYNIILKARQLGLSTLCASYVAWLITFYKDKEVYIIATRAETATNLVSRVKVVMENLPEWMRPKYKVDNRQSIELTNGSRVKASGTTANAARSESLSLLIIDEAAFITGMDEIWTAAQPTLATGGDCIALSTPNGMGNWFHQYYQKASEGFEVEIGGRMIGFNPILLHWSRHPDRDEKWAENEKKKIGIRAFAQEHDTDFLQSGTNVIEYADLNWYNTNPSPEAGTHDILECPYIHDPIEKTWIGKNLWIWKYPEIGRSYIISCDVARGDGNDFSAFHVIDIEDYEQVAEYKGQISTDMYAQLIVSTATQYNQAFVVVENVGIGHSVCMGILGLDYRNFYWTIKDPGKINQENFQQYEIDLYNVPKNAVPGFTTSGKTRPQLIARLEEDIRTKEFIFHSKRFFDECMTFVYESGKPQAMKGYNDDLIMSAAIGLHIRFTQLTLFGKSSDENKSMLSGMNIDSTPYGLSQIQTEDQKNQDRFMLDVGVGKEDLRWLY